MYVGGVEIGSSIQCGLRILEELDLRSRLLLLAILHWLAPNTCASVQAFVFT